ncbi:trypsin-like serine protease [Streptomyces sp. NPDC057651]|uniref:trypsin-like serine protease n=1 Tax=unclassified Streptomyces TaxID=2593676 RepID=UPI00369B8E4E
MRTEGIADLFEQFPDVKATVDSGYRGLAKQFPDQVSAPPLKPKKNAPAQEWAAYVFESNVCALGGDSGGPALNGSTALGLLSGGTGETVCNSSSSGTYLNYFMPVQKVLNDHGLHVY